MSSPSPKQALFGQFALVAKALGHPQRLELVEQIGQGPRSVEVLAVKLGLPVANVSQHLQNMRRAGLVAARPPGRLGIYRLSAPAGVGVGGGLQRIAEHNLAEVDKIVRGYFDERDTMEPVSRGELAERMKDGLVTVLDVRPEDEFALGHVPGAINVPLDRLEDQLATLGSDREVVAYCRGAYCVLSYEAVSKLRSKGIKARRLEDGMPEWIAAGLPVETQV